MSELDIERQIADEQDNSGDQATEEEASRLDRDVRTKYQIEKTQGDLGALKSSDFFERKGNNIYYKLDKVNDYLRQISTSNGKIKEILLGSNRKTLITAVQIALYKSGYLPVGWIDGKRGGITRGAVDKFQRENGLGGQRNPGYLNVKTINKLIEVSTKKEEKNKKNDNQENKTSKTPTVQQKPKQRRRVVNIPKPEIDTSERVDGLRVNRPPYVKQNTGMDLQKTLDENLTPKERLDKRIRELDKKGSRMWQEIAENVGTFREWHNGDYKFEFKNDVENFPDYIDIMGERYKYSTEGDGLNGNGFETYDGGWSFQIGEYAGGNFSFGVKYSYDGLREIGKFNEVGDLIYGIQIVNGVREGVGGYEIKDSV